MKTPSPPILYTPDVETFSDDETEVIEGSRDTMLSLSRTMNEHQGHATRSVPAKSFGLLYATLEVLPSFPSTFGDNSIEWPEDQSPYVAVARIRIGSQPAWSESRSKAMDDGLSFNPWHGLEAHRPLGGVMRARKVVYPASVAFRGATNGCPTHEPSSLDKLGVVASSSGEAH